MTVGPDLGIEHLADVVYLGAGGFGAVYAATDTQLDRRVAVKVLRNLPSPAGTDRFDRERKAMGRLSGHPNIVTLYQTGYTTTGDPYLMMELVDGGNLAERLATSGPLPWPVAVSLLIPVSRALAYAHERGVLHRDVKPANILLHQGVPKLADFGIARLTDAARTVSGGGPAMSLAHAAPETFSDQRDERSDIYSLVSTLHHLIAGRAPFWRSDEGAEIALLNRILSEPPRPLGPTLVPSALDDLILHGLAKNPDQRPRTAAELVDALDRMVARDSERTVSYPYPASPAGHTAPTRPASPVGPGGRRTLGLVAAAAGAAALGALSVGLALQLGTGSGNGDGDPTSTANAGPAGGVASGPSSTATPAGSSSTADDPASGSTTVPAPPLALAGHTDVVTSVAWLGDGRLVSSSNDRTVRVWAPELALTTSTAPEPAGVFTRHLDVVWSVTALTDGRVASASWDGTVQIWDPTRPDGPVVVLPHPDRVWSVVPLPGGLLATGSGGGTDAGADNAVRLWDLARPDEPVAVLAGAAADSTVSLAVSATGDLVGASLDGTVRIWDPARPDDPPLVLQDHGGEQVWQVAPLPDGRMASAGRDDSLRIWDPADPDGTPLVLTHPDDVLTVTVLDDGRLVTGCEDGQARVWDVDRPGQPVLIFSGHQAQVITVDGGPGGRVASSGWDEVIRIWSS